MLRGVGFFGTTPKRRSSRDDSSLPRQALTPWLHQYGLPLAQRHSPLVLTYFPHPLQTSHRWRRTPKSSFFQLGLTPDTQHRHSRCISSALSSPNQKSSPAQIPRFRRGAAKDKHTAQVQQQHLSGTWRTNIKGCQCCRGTDFNSRIKQIHVWMSLRGPLRVSDLEHPFKFSRKPFLILNPSFWMLNPNSVCLLDGVSSLCPLLSPPYSWDQRSPGREEPSQASQP